MSCDAIHLYHELNVIRLIMSRIVVSRLIQKLALANSMKIGWTVDTIMIVVSGHMHVTLKYAESINELASRDVASWEWGQ